MVFAPDVERDRIRREQQERQARESFRKQARENLRGSKNFASEQNTLLRERDKQIRDDLANAAKITKHQVPQGTDTKGMLELTFGNDKGKLSQTLTDDDLRTFSRNVATAQERFAGGITPQQVIDLSRDIDRERSNKQIFLAAPFQRKGDTFRYLTNAGPDSKDTRHYVTVQFLGYANMLTGAKEKKGQAIRNNVTNGKIRFTCDCGRHRYYYNYLAGVGNYHLGQKELRFPFIRNPNLGGVACKHVLRVMQVITSPLGVDYVVKQVQKDRAMLDRQEGQAKTTRTDLNAEFDRQLKQADGKRSQVTPTTERAGYKRKMQNAARKAAQEQAAKENQRAERIARQARLDGLFANGLMPEDDYKFYSEQNK
jgi:hypothetical protein